LWNHIGCSCMQIVKAKRNNVKHVRDHTFNGDITSDFGAPWRLILTDV
jgi:hypothetical protein